MDEAPGSDHFDNVSFSMKFASGLFQNDLFSFLMEAGDTETARHKSLQTRGFEA